MPLTVTKGLVLAGALALAGCLEVPEQALLSERFTPADDCLYPSLTASSPLPAQFSLLSWNIYKQQGEWQPELSRWMENTDLLLLQEASGRQGLYQWLAQHQLDWFQAAAFSWQQLPNGVLTASRSHAAQVCAGRMTEPATRIPKSLLFSRYSLQGSAEQLLVVNLHAVNFSLRGRTYQAQLDMISKAMAGHRGPVIVAGDFNRWNARRQQQLNRWAEAENLTEAIPSPDVRTRFWGYPLDAIFYRDLTLIQAHSVGTHASDHTPLKATFSATAF
ncbi:endonuclease/exonuclease/phosphatase family protein [Oceanimonas baumannii]|uniref:endonuclease/exonuclease/phosphatase family protein n=1 Tax=Oceanimonas baumannii TaxID=129578 RepID=UPI001D18E8B7|nr:endonuclease/exonuclease/phosphatase family protein [Oceanimonas baumannii]MCC4263621.1 endonuclease/exonuclease/phosphatase family protein [Oceanimonas baumannii]